MENPCKKCLVQVNCTQVCPDKVNFQVWLKNAIEQYGNGRHATTPHLRLLYKKYQTMQTENITDISQIELRRYGVEHPDEISS